MRQRISYDEICKGLFSNDWVISDLVKVLGYDTWGGEQPQVKRLPTERIYKGPVTGRLRKSIADTLWEVKWKNKTTHLIVALEFQATVDPLMSLRMATYTALAHSEFSSNKRANGELCPVLPVVFYLGDKQWTAAKSTADLFSRNIHPDLDKYQLKFEYLLLDLEGYNISREEDFKDSLVLPLLNLKRCDRGKAQITINRLIKQLAGDKYKTLRELYALFFNEVLQLEVAPKEQPTTLEEVKTMVGLAQKWVNDAKEQGLEQGRAEAKGLAQKWVNDAKEQGLEQGLEQGRAEAKGLAQKWVNDAKEQGLEQGQKSIILAQLEAKFGKLSPKYRTQFSALRNGQILKIATVLLRVDTVREVFEAAEDTEATEH